MLTVQSNLTITLKCFKPTFCFNLILFFLRRDWHCLWEKAVLAYFTVDSSLGNKKWKHHRSLRKKNLKIIIDLREETSEVGRIFMKHAAIY